MIDRRYLAAVVAVWLAFLVDSFAISPIPGVNEPHYLCKAKHFWNPQWCDGDLFLESSNPHFVFYVAIGWLTLGLPLPVVAVVGRVVALLALAIGWTGLVHRATGSLVKVLPAAGAFLVLQGIGDFSGEWIVGGVEAKVFSYAALFQAIAWTIGRRYRLAALGFGIAVSFHPVTGLWGVLALGVVASAHVVRWRSATRETEAAAPPLVDGKTAAAAVLIFVLASLPGLIPALLLLLEPVPPRVAFAGDYLQVFHRLPHHLDPMAFPPGAYWWYGVLLGGWGALAAINRGGRGAGKLLTQLILASLLIAAVGFLAGAGPRPPVEMPGYEWRMKILKFYPFRLFDVLLPIGVAVESVRALRLEIVRGAFANGWTTRNLWGSAAVFLALGVSLGIAANDRARNPSKLSPAVHQDWLALCDWVRHHTPTDAVFVTPRMSWAFKWYAQRAEYVAFKDAPQDAAGLVEWNRRQNFLRDWASDAYDDQLYSVEELRQFAESEDVDYLIVDRLGPMEIEPVFRSRYFRVYRLP